MEILIFISFILVVILCGMILLSNMKKKVEPYHFAPAKRTMAAARNEPVKKTVALTEHFEPVCAREDCCRLSSNMCDPSLGRYPIIFPSPCDEDEAVACDNPSIQYMKYVLS